MKQDAQGAVAYALGVLKAKLRPNLVYHNVWHTRHDVMPAVVRLATAANLDRELAPLLRVAAAFHDLGFIERAKEHEQLGADMAVVRLPEFGFTTDKIGLIQGMIMATRLPQSPHTLSEALLADADLDVLGREDFLARNAALRTEMASLGQAYTDVQWYSGQLKFVSGHRYFSAQARELRDEGKARNAAAMKRLLEAAEASP